MRRRISSLKLAYQTAPPAKGFSLVEMMIAATLGLILLASILSAFTSSVQSSSENTNRVKVGQELDTVLDFMSDEIRRAGYNINSQLTNYLSTSNTSFGVTVPTSSCVLFQYDRTGGNNGVVDNNEKFGFRLSGNSVQYGENVTSCNTGTWQSITDSSSVNVSNLNFVLSETCTNVSAIPVSSNCAAATSGQLLVRAKQIQITVTGKSNAIATAPVRSLSSTIKIRNDQWEQVP